MAQGEGKEKEKTQQQTQTPPILRFKASVLFPLGEEEREGENCFCIESGEM